MKITDIQCHVMRVPDTTGDITLRNWIFVTVHTDEGITGIGEATTEYHECAVKAQIETELKPRLLGMDPTDIERIWQLGHRDFWWRRGVVHTSALSGIDQALWDIAGKAAGLPVYKLLGGAVRDRVRCYIRYGPEFHGKTLEHALQACMDMKFDAFKFGFGTPVEPYDGMKQVDVALAGHRLARQMLGPDRALMIDAAGMFDPPAAHRLMAGLEPLDMLFVEEPTNMDTVEPTLRLKGAFPGMPIAVGERMMTRWDFRDWFERQAIDVCQADMCHAGGISELMKIAHYAEVYGITLAPHNPYGPVALAACAHAAAAMQNFLILEHCPIQPWFDKVQTQAVPIVDGYIPVDELAQRPGLGVALDMELVVSQSKTFTPMKGRRYEQADGSTPLL
jgi:galactonate dehydratase